MHSIERLTRSALRVSALALFVALPLAAAPPHAAERKADRIITAVMHEKQIPGLVLAIVENGTVVVEKGYGVRESGGAPPGVNTVFAIGSLSKALTAFGAMRLVDEGKLDLDAPASRYLAALPPAWKDITVRQFMTHTSGIPQLDDKQPDFAAMLDSARGKKLKFKPGTDQDYNNFNFAVVGKIIEAVSGKRYLDYMHERVFEPLGMSHTGRFGTVKTNDRATGYAPRPNGPKPVDRDGPAGDYGVPSGWLESTIDDLVKFESALQEERLMKPKTYRAMFTPTVVPGLHAKWSFTPGWQAREAGKLRVVAKNGAVTGFSSQFHYVPDRKDAVIMIWNTKGQGLDLWGTSADLLDQCLGIPKP